MAKNKKSYKIKIDNVNFEYESRYITGQEIRELGEIPADYGLWLHVPGPDPDEVIELDEKVDLKKPGREKFFSGPTGATEG